MEDFTLSPFLFRQQGKLKGRNEKNKRHQRKSQPKVRVRLAFRMMTMEARRQESWHGAHVPTTFPSQYSLTSSDFGGFVLFVRQAERHHLVYSLSPPDSTNRQTRNGAQAASGDNAIGAYCVTYYTDKDLVSSEWNGWTWSKEEKVEKDDKQELKIITDPTRLLFGNSTPLKSLGNKENRETTQSIYNIPLHVHQLKLRR